MLISACLLGVECNHEGRGSPRAVVEALEEHYRLVPVCPEVLGGLPTPRAAAELTGGDGADVLGLPATGDPPGGSPSRLPTVTVRQPLGPAAGPGARVVNIAGEDVTAAYRRGAEAAVALARAVGATRAVLKARSPSCGSSAVYDGTFSRRLVPGQGVTAAALATAGLTVGSEEDAPELLGPPSTPMEPPVPAGSEASDQ